MVVDDETVDVDSAGVVWEHDGCGGEEEEDTAVKDPPYRLRRREEEDRQVPVRGRQYLRPWLFRSDSWDELHRVPGGRDRPSHLGHRLM